MVETFLKLAVLSKKKSVSYKEMGMSYSRLQENKDITMGLDAVGYPYTQGKEKTL